MLGGLALCRCGNHITSSVNHLGVNVYRCNQQTRDGRPGPHVAVKRADVDEAIGRLVVGRLSKADAADLVAPAARGNATALRDDAQAIRAKLARLGVGRSAEKPPTPSVYANARRLAIALAGNRTFCPKSDPWASGRLGGYSDEPPPF